MFFFFSKIKNMPILREEVKMLIYCPKCKTGYEIDASVVPEQGRRLRCAVCQKVFKCMPEDLIEGSKLRAAEFTEEEKKHLDEKGQLQEEPQIKDSEENQVTPEKSEDNITEDKEADSPEKAEDWEEEVAATQKTLDELASDNQYVKDIFQRLSVETENLFQIDQEHPKRKYIFGIRKMLGIVNPKNLQYYLYGLLIFLGLILYYMRYEVVRSFPSTAQVYEALGIEAVVPGEGLEFQNVVRREFEDDYVPKLEIKGFIANKTDINMDIPKIKIELLDKNGKVIQSENFDSIIPLVTAKAKIPFSHIISRPSPLSKYVYLTFINLPPEEAKKK